jgi:hypothetical protein
MNCEEFRRAVGAEPMTTRLEVLEHAAGCAECARFRSEMRSLDGLIHEALTIDLAVAPAQMTPRTTPFNWRIAATILVSVAVLALGWIAYPSESLAKDIVTHVLSESRALDPTDRTVDPQALQAVLRRAGVSLDANDLDVSFAAPCWIRGRRAPHFVVRTASGPVTVIVLSEEASIAHPQSFAEQGFVGTLVPAPRGVVAVLGRDVPVTNVTSDVLSALRYE